MNDDAAHNRPQPTGDDQAAETHISADQLNAYLGGEMTTAERASAGAHLETCAACRRDLADLQTTVTLLKSLPEQRPRRGFQLGPEHARVPRGPRLFRLMPSVSTLRTATAVVAMLLIAVITGDVLTNQTDEPDRAAQDAPSIESTARDVQPAEAAPAITNTPASAPTRAPEAAVQPAPTDSAARQPGAGQQGGVPNPTPTRERMSAFAEPAQADEAPAGGDAAEAGEADEEAPPAAPAADSAAEPEIASDEGDASAVEDASVGESAGADSGAGGESISQAQAVPPTASATATATASPTATPSPSPSPAPTAIPTATVTATATTSSTPAPTPTPVAQPTDDGSSRPSLWRVAEIGLGLLLLWLLVSLLGARRLRR